MSIGMTYDQYWREDPKMVRAFYEAEKLRQEQRDADAWLIGSYVGKAIDATIGNVFRKNRGSAQTYPDLPELTKRRMEKEEEQKAAEKEEKEKTFALAWMSSFVQAGRNWGKKG